MRFRRPATSISSVRELRSDTLIVFLSDCHIGGDPGCDAFEANDELEELFDEFADHGGPVELVLAGDFFDLLQVDSPRQGLDRAGETVERLEYQGLFGALRRFNEVEGHRTIYVPGNHDAEVFWNPQIRQTLMSKGLVSEFALCYAACLVPEGEDGKVRSRTVYCEHGNQFDPANVVSDYTDPLDTPLGHHMVTDFTRRIGPVGKVTGELDLSDLKRIYPLVEIPRWIASRLFYDLMSRVLRYLLLPLLVAYVAYRGIAYYLASRAGSSATLWESFHSLPKVQELFLDVYFFAVLSVIVLGVFFIALRRTVRRALSAFSGFSGVSRLDSTTGSGDTRAARVLGAAEESVLRANRPPMADGTIPWPPDVFVFGHTHTPSLKKLELPERGEAAVINSGCWLRQLSPVPARLHGPPVFVSRFTCTHARVYLEESKGERLKIELWERPKPSGQRLGRVERLAALGRIPRQLSGETKTRLKDGLEL